MPASLEIDQTSAPLAVLVIDGDPLERTRTFDALAGGHRVEAVGGLRDARGALAARPVDVIVAHVLPPVAGAVAELRRLAPLADLVLVAAAGSVADAVSATRAGALYLEPPSSAGAGRAAAVADQLRAALGEVAARRRAAGLLAGPALIGSSPEIAQLRRSIEVIGHSDGAVTIHGEPGTGKELIARLLHAAGPRRGRPLEIVNCAAFGEAALDLELFGVDDGDRAQVGRRPGRLVAAHGGTVVLDEIAAMPLATQATLLRALDQAARDRAADLRVIATTHEDLDRLVAAGRFRPDLRSRLRLFRLEVPALRERRADLPLLVEHFCQRHAPGAATTLSPWAWAALRAHDFPGNVRELEQAVRHALAFAAGGPIHVEHLPIEIAMAEAPPAMGTGSHATRSGHGRAPAVSAAGPVAGAVEPGAAREPIVPLGVAIGEFEHAYLLRALDQCAGNRSLAARMLGISRKSLWAKLKRHGADRSTATAAPLNLSVTTP